MALRENNEIIIGVGNAYRRDDAAGLIVARRLRNRLSGRVTIIEQSGEGTALMEAWLNAKVVYLIDAVSSGNEAGKIYRFDAHAQPIPTKFFNYSTHTFSLAEAIEVARALNQLPQRLIVYGIEGADFTSGVQLSEKVEAALPQVVAQIETEIDEIETK